MKDYLDAGDNRRFCWLCFVGGLRNRLDEESRCHAHGLVKDRIVAIVQVDTRLLDTQAAAKDGRSRLRGSKPKVRSAGKKKSTSKVRLTGQDAKP